MDIENKIYNMVMERAKNKKEASELKDTDDLVYDLGLDSLSLVELVVDIEIEFDIEIDQDDISCVYKYGNLVKYIKENI